jgi:hypothetical protein
MLLFISFVFKKLILTEIHYRCQFCLTLSSHFSSRNTKSIKKTLFEYRFLFLEFLEKNIFEKWTQSKGWYRCQYFRWRQNRTKQDWKFFHSLSLEKKMSKCLFKRLFFCNSWLAILDLQFWLAILDLQFLTCNSWLAILDLQFLTCNSWLAILNLQFLTRGNRIPCATGRHKMCHGKNVPQHGTKRLLNLCATGRHKKCHSTAQKDF